MRMNIKTEGKMKNMNAKKAMLSTTAIVAGVLMMSSVAGAQNATPSNSWDYDTVLGGNVGKDTSVAGTTDITVTGGNGYVSGNADIYSGHTVNVAGDDGATFAYNDNRANIQSTLDGNLNSNMNIVVIDKDGLFFTNNSVIDVNGIVATTGSVGVADVMNGGDLTIHDVDQGGAIAIDGQVTVAEAGLAAFVSPFITNKGVIQATAGTVALAAGEVVTLDMFGDGLVEVAVDGELADALINNKGDIQASGGVVNITAKAAKNTVDSLINNDGIITVSSASVSDGKIVLNGGDHGTVSNNGKIYGNSEGSIEISGERFAQENAHVPGVDGEINAQGGDIAIATTGDVEIVRGEINASGGDITIENGGEFTALRETIKTSGTGEITLTQNNGGSINNAIDAIDNTGTGTNTVNVGAGTYFEAVHANVENLVLKGANAGVSGSAYRGVESVIVPNSPGIFISADNVTVDGFEIIGGESGVRLYDADNATIINNKIHGQYAGGGIGESQGGYATGDGIFIHESAGTLIDSNKIYNMNDDGIHAANVTDITITNNKVIDFGDGDQGIGVSYSNGTTTIDNNIVIGTRRDGIQLHTVTGDSNITNNKILSSGRNGVSVVSTNGAEVSGNLIIGADDDGVDVYDSNGVNIDNNKISLIGENGVEVTDSSFVDVTNNSIKFIDQDGVHVENGFAADIKNNEIKFTGDDGVDVDGSAYADINENTISRAGGNGIEVSESNFVDVNENTITSVTNDAVNLSGSSFADIKLNKIIRAGDDGVDVDDSFAVDIDENTISFIGDNGVQVSGSNRADVNDNIIKFVSGNGVEISDSNGAEVLRNEISFTGDDGIDLNYVDGADVIGNTVSRTGDDGIDIDGGSDIYIESNSVTRASENGVSIYEADDVTVFDNTISESGDDGVNVMYSGFVEIDNNIISESGDDGIDAQETLYVDITSNTITDSGDDGIYVAGSGYYPLFLETESQNDVVKRASIGSSSAFIFENTVQNSGGDGIQIQDQGEAIIGDNIVENSNQHGLYVSGISNGYVEVSGNEFTDNGGEEFAQARFESGDIDVSNIENPNAFTKTTPGTGVAMQFDDISEGDLISPQDDLSETAIVSVRQAQFPTGLRIVDETLGATEFTGYTADGSFYVRFENGSILNPLTNAPIVIDATNASFDGIVPASFTDTILPIDTLQFIEDRLFDADDAVLNGRGQIFAGFAPAPFGPANFQDFLPELLNGQDLNNAASVTITSLPSIGDFGGDNTGGLNNLEPAAGGNGNDPQDLANLEPAAGEGQDGQSSVTCLGDAVTSLGGGAVTYNFGGSLEDSIAGASGCQSNEI